MNKLGGQESLRVKWALWIMWKGFHVSLEIALEAFL